MAIALEIELGGSAETYRDRGELIDVYRDAYDDKLDNPFFHEDRHWQRLEGYAKAPGYALAEGRIGGRMVGYGLGYRLPEGGRWWRGLMTPVDPALLEEDGSRTFALNYIMVLRDYRRRGIARQLHDALLSSRPEKRATLLVQPSNTAARTAYDHWGWYKIGDLQPFDDAPIYDALLKDLEHE